MGVSVEVKLVGHHQAKRTGRTLAQGLVSEDLGGCADDWRIGVDRGVACDHAHVGRAEVTGQGEELLADQCLNGGGVDAAVAAGQGRSVGRYGHQRLPGSGGGGQHNVTAAQNL